MYVKAEYQDMISGRRMSSVNAGGLAVQRLTKFLYWISEWVHFCVGSGFPSYSFLPTTTSVANSERLGTSFYPEYGTASAANQMVATMMARQGDSQLALSTPTLLADHYLSQRGVHSVSTSAARNVLSLPDHASDFGICRFFSLGCQNRSVTFSQECITADWNPPR